MSFNGTNSEIATQIKGELKIKEIFASYPELTFPDIFSAFIFSLIGFICIVSLLILIVIVVYSIYFIIRENSKKKRNNELYDGILMGLFIEALLFSLVLSSGMTVGLIYCANDLKENRVEGALAIKVVRDWYEKNASSIDQELTLNEYEYVEYEFSRIPPSGKSQIYFNAIGFEPVGKLSIEGITKQGDIKRFTAFIDIIEDSSIEKSRTLKLKYTSEFGEDYDLGDGIYYGHLYMSDFDSLKLNTTMNRK